MRVSRVYAQLLNTQSCIAFLNMNVKIYYIIINIILLLLLFVILLFKYIFFYSVLSLFVFDCNICLTYTRPLFFHNYQMSRSRRSERRVSLLLTKHPSVFRDRTVSAALATPPSSGLLRKNA